MHSHLTGTTSLPRAYSFRHHSVFPHPSWQGVTPPCKSNCVCSAVSRPPGQLAAGDSLLAEVLQAVALSGLRRDVGWIG